MPSASLTTSPPEIQLHIFSYVCADSGRTGSSLSHVCRHFRQLCQGSAVDIQHVSICGPSKMRGFLQVLVNRSEESRRVESLYVTYRGEGKDVDVKMEEATVERYALILEVLNTISPDHLRILSVNYPQHRYGLPRMSLLPRTYPSLSELSINGAISQTFIELSCPAPGLERLHIGDCEPFYMSENILRHVMDLFPCITHLRISNLAQIQYHQNSSLARLLRAYCMLEATGTHEHAVSSAASYDQSAGPPKPSNGNLANASPAPPANPTIPPSLRRIIIGVKPNNGYMCGMLAGDCYRTKALFQTISREQHTFGVGEIEPEDDGSDLAVRKTNARSLLILQWPSDMEFDVDEVRKHAIEDLIRFRRDWVERTTGSGRGCWIRGDAHSSILTKNSDASDCIVSQEDP